MIDGVFTHYLTIELKSLINLRINKFASLKDTDFFLTIQNRNTLLFSLNSNTLNVRLTKAELQGTTSLTNFQKVLKKYLESSIIKDVTQYNNDRIIIFDIASFDELGYVNNIKLIFELFGRNCNLILTDSSFIIIDAYKRCFEDSINARVILPKAKYAFPVSDKVNPYEKPTQAIYNLDGVSTFLLNELEYRNSNSLIYEDIKPTLTESDKKWHFYCYDLSYLEGKRTYFNTLSELMDYYFINVIKDENKNTFQLSLIDKINKEINKINHKIAKQNNEYLHALENLIYNEYGNILASNLYLVKKGDKKLTTYDFYHDKEITLTLDPLLSPNQNLTNYFNKYQKAKRAITEIEKQIANAKNDLEYYNCLLSQLKLASKNDVMEIYEELKATKLIGNEIKASKVRKAKPNFLTYQTPNGDKILVGKNNIQNNYITHTLAKDNDYFFHVQNVPGSHVILKTENLTNELVELVSSIAAYYSSYKDSTNVCVDYVLVKYVRKVPGTKGSFVTYKNFKSVFAKPDIDYIKEHTV